MVRFIVLTGGPGAGKTAVMEAARQIFSQQVAILPESASIVYGGGFPRTGTPSGIRAAQRAICRVQEELESLASGRSFPEVVLCDRGISDGAAYWPDGYDSFFRSVGISRDQVFARYHKVIHLRTPTAEWGYDHSNPVRTESAAEAAELDLRIERAWDGHPNRIIVPARETFPEKLDHVTNLIRETLPDPLFSSRRSLRLESPSLHV